MLLALISLGYVLYQCPVGSDYSAVQRQNLVKRHSVYVLAFILMWVWPTVHSRIDPDDTHLGFTIVDVVFLSGQTIMLSVVRLSEPGAWKLLVDSIAINFMNLFQCCFVRALWIGDDLYGSLSKAMQAAGEG